MESFWFTFDEPSFIGRHRSLITPSLDETRLAGLIGVVKISHIVLEGAFLVRLDGFATAGRWQELCPGNLEKPQVA